MMNQTPLSTDTKMADFEYAGPINNSPDAVIKIDVGAIIDALRFEKKGLENEIKALESDLEAARERRARVSGDLQFYLELVERYKIPSTVS